MNIIGTNKMSAEQVVAECTSVPNRADIVKNDTAVNPKWKPISHGAFVETMHGAIEHHGLAIIDSSFALNKTGHLIVGGFQVKGDILPPMPGGIDGTYELFVRHANDMSRGVQVNAGVQLMVCTNGCLTGEVLAKHKHTSAFDVKTWAYDTVIKEFVADCLNQTKELDNLRAVDCSDELAAKTILEAGSRGIIPMARTVDIWNEWKEPVFNAEDFPLNTAFKLMGDLTHVAQKCSPARQHTILQASMPLVKEFCVNNVAKHATLF